MIVSGILARSLGRAFSRRGVADGVGFAVSKITRWLGTIVGVFIALTTIGVNMNAALAAMAVLLVGIGFGLQKMAENFISGLILLIERPVRVGDFVEVDGHTGTVVDIGLRATRVVTRDGFTVVVPNGDLITKAVTNFMAPTEALRIWVEVGVAYGSDLARVRQILLDVAAAEPMVKAEPAPDVIHRGFGDSSLDLALVAWIGRAPDDVIAKSKLRFAIDAALRANDIVIPFPQRDLYIKQAPPGRGVG
ncbi:MAG: mechanosensitive ion channel [Kofleriaceae bacterium]